MANASSKRITHANQAALTRLTYTLALSHLAHLILRALFRPRPLFSAPSYLLVLLFAAAAFAYSFLSAVGKPRTDKNGVLRGTVELEGNVGGVVEWALDFVYFGCAVQVITPILGYKWYYLILMVPAFAAYKLYAFASPLLFGGRGGSTAGPSEPVGLPPKEKEQTKTQAKKAKKMEKLERMQMNGRR